MHSSRISRAIVSASIAQCRDNAREDIHAMCFAGCIISSVQGHPHRPAFAGQSSFRYGATEEQRNVVSEESHSISIIQESVVSSHSRQKRY